MDPRSGDWIFKDFTLDRLDEDGEGEICSAFVQYVSNLIDRYGCFEPPSIYHWSHAEPSAWKRAYERHLPGSFGWNNLVWVDLLKVFQNEPIGIKGCLNYGLKNVAKTFYKHGYISTIWDSGSSCADGADAAVGAYRVDKETRKRGVSFKSDPLAQEIIKYNEVDCKVLQEIIFFLRIHHIDPDDSDLEDNLGLLLEEGIDMSISEDSDTVVLYDEDNDNINPYIIESIDSDSSSDNSDSTEELDRIEDSVDRIDNNDNNDNSDRIDNNNNIDSDSSYEPDDSDDGVDWYEYHSLSEESDDDDVWEDISNTEEEVFDILEFFDDDETFRTYIFLCDQCGLTYNTSDDCDRCQSHLIQIDPTEIYYCKRCQTIARSKREVCDCGKQYTIKVSSNIIKVPVK